MSAQEYVRWFHEIRLEDVPLGGKNASLGELYCALASEGVRVPNGFVLTAQSHIPTPTFSCSPAISTLRRMGLTGRLATFLFRLC
jgi:hypothetical protein